MKKVILIIQMLDYLSFVYYYNFFFFFENRMFDDKRIDWSQVRPVLPAKALRNSDENGRQRPPLASLLNNYGKSPISRLKWTKPNEN